MVAKIWSRIDRRIVILVAVILVAAVALNVVRSPAQMKTVTAHFPRAVSVYPGTDVRILGVSVGRVTAVIPEGNSVRVDIEYDASYRVPEDAKAVVVTPTLVADRFVQLTPVYTRGDVMADGADIPLPDTAVPVELDRIYASLQTLTTTLGPNGVNKNGTLNNVMKAARNAFDGQGARGNRMIRELSVAAETFGEGAGPLFEAVTQLAEFTTTLADNDQLVQAFMKDLAGVSDLLADESDELQQAVAAVAGAVGEVKGFLGDNRTALVKDVRQLTTTISAIASERDNLDTALRIAPVAMANLNLGFDIASMTQNSRINFGNNIWDLDGFICATVKLNPDISKSMKKLACDLLEEYLEPLVTSLPWKPAGITDDNQNASYAPGDTQRGFEVPVRPVTYSAPDDASVTGLLGGAQ
ncbi:MCE family protein [Nocardioides sp. GY 10113]|uniref:MCE family protein n=1 Tax=Nocardioides sp. GY 10113 TaxID=2569761 RepID=UPI0010A7AE6B|nr:MCE family protein [Nocardioides sp. GY 10113]TIC83887.1 MCE family protein [Nocardioides sp. GY 10113]